MAEVGRGAGVETCCKKKKYLLTFRKDKVEKCTLIAFKLSDSVYIL